MYDTKDYPLISVIVPIYNVEKYLEICIESIIKQLYSNLEIILVDDGSTDRSAHICDKYKSNDSRIIVIHKKNEGIGNARNSGLNIATGKYIFFIDSDDYIESTLILRLWEEITLTNADTIISGYKRVTDKGKCISITSYESKEYYQSNIKNYLIPKFIGSSPSFSDSLISVVWGNLYSHDLIKKYNIRFMSEKEIFSEDMIFLVDYLIHSNKTQIISNTNYLYRCNNNSFTNSYKENLFCMSKILYSYMIDKIQLYNLPTETLTRLKKRMFIYLRQCISTETKKISLKPYRQCIKSINNICKDNMIINIINDYPIHKLNLKQKIFLYLIKYNMSYTLYLLSSLRLI